MDSEFYQCRRRLHVYDLGRAGIADRPGAAHEQDAALVDAERGIVDAAVIVLRSVEYHGAAFEGIGVLRVAEIAAAKFVRYPARLHDRGFEQIAMQHLESGLPL